MVSAKKPSVRKKKKPQAVRAQEQSAVSVSRDQRPPQQRGLVPFKKWVSGNPGGRPKNGPDITAMLRAEGSKNIPDVPELNVVLVKMGLKPGCTWAEMVVRSLFINAAKGNSAAIREVWDRMDGKVPLPIQGVPGGAPVGIEVSIGSGREKALQQLAEMNRRMGITAGEPIKVEVARAFQK